MAEETVVPPPPRRKRSGGRAGNARGRGPAIAQPAWHLPEYLDNPVEPLTGEGVEKVHDAAMRILEEIGIQFLHDDAIAILRREGCKIMADGVTVRMGRDFVMEKIATCPRTFTITPRNPDRAIEIGGNRVVFGQVGSPPNYSNLDEGRKTGTFKAFTDLIKFTHYFDCIHYQSGYPVEPVDIHPAIRHLDCIREKLVLSDKVCHAYSLGTERIEDAIELVRIAGGLTDEQFDATPRMFTNINSTSPLSLTVHSCRGDGARDAGRSDCAADCRGSRSACPAAMRAARFPGGLRLVHLECGYEDRCPRFWDARIYPRDADVGTDGAVLRPAPARLQCLRGQFPRCTGGMGE